MPGAHDVDRLRLHRRRRRAVPLQRSLRFEGNVRYFTALGEHPAPVPQNLSYWRITVGATFVWAIAP